MPAGAKAAMGPAQNNAAQDDAARYARRIAS